MIRLYHGTTEEAYRSILEHGFCHNDVVWTCSDPSMLYFYSDELIAEEFELGKPEAVNKCLEMALESAMFSAAVTNSASCNLYIFELLVDDRHRNIIKADHSMRNSSACSVCIDTKLLNQLAHNIYCAPEHYTPRLALFYLGMLEPEYLPDLKLSRFEKSIIEKVIPFNLDLFQTGLADFLSGLDISLLHENVCINEIASAMNTDQKEQRKHEEIELNETNGWQILGI